MSGVISDPVGKFRFSVKVGEHEVGRFQSVGGLSHEIEVVSHQEGGLNDRVHMLPGQGKFANVVLKRGYLVDPFFEDWHMQFARDPNGAGRKDVSVDLFADDGRTVLATWNVARAWPAKWQGPELDSSGGAIAIETVELAHRGVSRG